jgi:hypothetical protein
MRNKRLTRRTDMTDNLKDTTKNLSNIANEARISLEKASCITNMMIDSADGNPHDYTEDTPLLVLNDYLTQVFFRLYELDEKIDTLKQA